MSFITAPRYMPIDPPAKCKPGDFGLPSPAVYLAIVNQLEVHDNERYRAVRNDKGQIITTWCNIFAADVTAAMGVPIPHWIDPVTNAPSSVGHGTELTANATYDWLELHGRRFGWEPSTREAAVLAAAAGVPAVSVYKNPDPHGHGHIVCLIPGPDREATIAQAGAENFASTRYERGMGNLPTKFYVASAYLRAGAPKP